MISRSTATLLTALISSVGCSSVVKQNIISTINTGIGASLTENPQTQLYEVKVGYIRSQFYSVPTGKVVCANDDTNCAPNNAADVTPDIVSGIRMSSGAQHLFLGVDVSENFAVGRTAVMSPAAVAMYVADASSDTKADAAARAAAASSLENVAGSLDANSRTLQRSIIARRTAASDSRRTAIDEVLRQNGFASWNDFIDARPSQETLQRVKSQIDALDN